jgi:polysaccharide pyruvyl transferase WcaK-like protein
MRRVFRRLFDSRLKVGYIGGHFCGNLGDEIMYKCFCDFVQPAALETLESPGVEELLSKFGLSGPAYFHRYIFGGGTLINPIWRGKVDRLSQMNVPIVSIGTGVGSCGKEQADDIVFEDWKPVLERFDSIHLRGDRSCKKLQDLGLSETAVCGDVALSLYQELELDLGAKRVAINVLRDSATEAQVADIIRRVIPLLRSHGYSIDAWILNEEDVAFTEEVFGEHIDRLLVLRTHDDILQAAKGVRFTVCTRLHAAVFSVTCCIPTVLLAYRDKCLDFMETVGLQDSCVDLMESDCVDQALRQIQLHFEDQYLVDCRTELMSRSSILKNSVMAAITSVVSSK